NIEFVVFQCGRLSRDAHGQVRVAAPQQFELPDRSWVRLDGETAPAALVKLISVGAFERVVGADINIEAAPSGVQRTKQKSVFTMLTVRMRTQRGEVWLQRPAKALDGAEGVSERHRGLVNRIG